MKFYGSTNLDQDQYKKSLYFRSAHRNDPDVNVNELRHLGNRLEQVRLNRTIENDAAVVQNYQRLAASTFGIYDLETPVATDVFVESIIAPVRDPILRLFPDLQLHGLTNPLEDGTFRFTKGTSKGFHFKNLSGGEKAAFDLILDLAIAIKTYDDTLFCIDEPESHMNTRVQAELLSVIYAMIPPNCQLMLATHSIGMMRRARDIAAEDPDSVVFLDFSDCDLDHKAVIRQTTPNRAFWNKAYKIAIDDLAELVAPECVVIFEQEFPETQFIPGGSSDEVARDSRGVAYALGILTGGVEIIKLVDRDDCSDKEIEDFQHEGVKVLSKRNLESYLMDDEILRKLASSVDKPEKAEALIEKKNEILLLRTGDAEDDLKPASGKIYNACKEQLSLRHSGNSVKTFMRDTLAPLVSQETNIYRELKSDIFGDTLHEASPKEQNTTYPLEIKGTI